MDPQLKRGLLDICVLSAISREDSYGYKIIKDLADVIEISESTLYPILRRLEGAGSLRSYSVEHNGRLRKFYSTQGKKMIIEFLAGGKWKKFIDMSWRKMTKRSILKHNAWKDYLGRK